MPGLVGSETPCTRLGVYIVIIIGLSSNSGYYLLGGLHALGQTISHEVRLVFILLLFVVLWILYLTAVIMLHAAGSCFTVKLYQKC
jgi:NADH:ubiquinone oxidoreductase subunit H